MQRNYLNYFKNETNPSNIYYIFFSSSSFAFSLLFTNLFSHLTFLNLSGMIRTKHIYFSEKYQRKEEMLIFFHSYCKKDVAQRE
jgi:hypothetical protein